MERSQVPRLAHSARLCASSVPVASSVHASDCGQVRRLQSPPFHPLSHWHTVCGLSHRPCPLHAFGQLPSTGAASAPSTAAHATRTRQEVILLRGSVARASRC